MKIEESLAHWLEGRWRFERHITAPAAVMQGEAHFTRQNISHLAYEEKGQLCLHDTPNVFESFRRYLYRFAPQAVTVFFADGNTSGKPFQTLAFRPLPEGGFTAKGIHFCGEDSYNSFYHLRSPSHFAITHHVTGPRKNYIAATTYSRPMMSENIR